MATGPSLYFLPAAGLFGFILGFVSRPYLVAPPEPVVQVEKVETVKELTDEQLLELCKNLTPSERSKLQEAQAQVVSLTGDLEAKQAELAGLQETMRKNQAAGAKAAARMRELEAQVETLQAQLVEVTTERDNLLVELKDTVQRLEVQIQETRHYQAEAKKWKAQSTEHAWRGFISQTITQICDRGTRKRHERCYEAVEGVMTLAIQDHFETCVDTYQAIPTLGQIEKRGQELPAFAELLEDQKDFTSHGWYIQFCDPTLPEAK